ncbi:MAG: hypothetical protein DHS20C11_01390 [Lysobacteraceae bacterium]|nr:MAG: hypothetical protein DHS20C11_01390 [Xanthomonadaceae bacterium]
MRPPFPLSNPKAAAAALISLILSLCMSLLLKRGAQRAGSARLKKIVDDL